MLLTGIGYVLTLSASLYALAALLCRARIYRNCVSRHPDPVLITVLKPLCGLEPRLEENLSLSLIHI